MLTVQVLAASTSGSVEIAEAAYASKQGETEKP